ncbi:FtsW/RodA/SpoVE family cell cycle protein [Metabacillus idriensis]|uniref:FtsW/RodA/SpoVE family cell cycle protein n=1 Tax=Metabacillus idriensis TaxID=324768 RepID=UPI00174B17EB|nr:FtsW/RodA/SpoVE family cell cycle protein [Metabacillus idriensis]
MEKNEHPFDFSLVFILFLFSIISFISINTAQDFGQYNENFLVKQIAWYIVGCGIILAVMYFDMEQIERIHWFAYGFAMLLLIFLIIAPESIARPINGAKSWFQIPKIGSLQPSELSKIALILTLSHIIAKHHLKYVFRDLKTDIILLTKMGMATLALIAIIMQQPDLGTSLVLLAIFAGLMLVSGISWKVILPIFLLAGSIGGLLIYLIVFQPDLLNMIGVRQYQLGRIYSWLNPEEFKEGDGYHLYQSMLAIGSGLITGKEASLGNVHLPEGHTDFIFSVIGEKYGFAGASFVISLYFLLIYRIISLSLDVKDPFTSYICTGVVSMIAFHVFQNAGMTIGLLPITGIPLPFISYGGSSMISNMLAIGLIFSISFRNKKYMFDRE